MEQGLHIANASDIRLLAARVQVIEHKFATMEPLIRETHDAVVYAKGGLKMVLAMGTAVAVLSGLVVEVIRWVTNK